MDLCTARCRRCRFGRRMDMTDDGRFYPACLYIVLTGRRRPCPPGDACTVYQRRAKRVYRPWEDLDG